MKRAIIWAFVFIVLVLLTAQAIDSNRAELTRSFAFRIDLPFIGLYQSTLDLSVAAYFGLCIILGGLVVMILSLGAVIKANLAVRQLRRQLQDAKAELTRLRGPAEDDEAYKSVELSDELK